MASKERFVVRTCGRAGLGFGWETTIAEGRPEAVRQLERIGTIDPQDRQDIREFLEGNDPPNGGAIFVASTVEDGSCRTGLLFKVTV